MRYWKIKNFKMFLDFNDPLDRTIILHKEYERHQFDFLIKEIQKNNSKIFLDIGANSGYYSFFVALEFPQIKIRAFEPNKIAFLKYQKTLNKNKFLKKQIKLYKFGASHKSGKLKMGGLIKDNYLQPGGSAILNKRMMKNPNIRTFYGNFKKIDEIFKIKKESLAIKIDVEGTENLTLNGMKNLLKKNNIILQIEIFNENFTTINKKLLKLGFKKINKINHDYFYRN
jgi:FkbM family methyltransferase